MPSSTTAPSPDPADLLRLLQLHRRALDFQGAQREADLVEAADPQWRGALAQHAAALEPAPGTRLLLNVSSLCRRRLPTSIDRVLLALHAGLANLPLQVVPVGHDGQVWREARAAPADADPSAPRLVADGPPVSPGPDDRLLMVDIDMRLPPPALSQLAAMKAYGVSITAVVHDIFLVSRPDWFAPRETLRFDAWLRRTCALADRIVCFSQHTARQLRRWLAMTPPVRGAARREIAVSVIDPGGDGLSEGGPAPQWSPQGGAADFRLPDDEVPTFLTIAAVHPRKGVDTLLTAFSDLWTEGLDARLVLSGRVLDPRLHARIQDHPRFGDRLLFPGFLGDAQLRQVAARAQAMIIPSREEGFGLAMAEAANLGLPVIARDIPVFREVAGDQPFWFGSAPGRQHTLTARMREWLAMPAPQRRLHGPARLGTTWQGSARQLAAVMLAGLDFDRLSVELPPATPTART